ncbi:MAG TPA: hypothetical protein VMY77_14180 [Chitinophagaceae bacterium]|nr:hypothetical protein [Chitinophagaceae bacterium]
MKILFTISILFTHLHFLGQTTIIVNENEVIRQILRPEINKHEEIVYTHRLNKGVLEYDTKEFIKTSTRFFNKKGDTLILSKSEKKYIITQLRIIKDHVWKDSLFNFSHRIPEDSTASYLKANKARELYQFSKPIFIRNNSICLIYMMRLCCGGIYGPTHLGFYKIQNGFWKNWITVFSGAF